MFEISQYLCHKIYENYLENLQITMVQCKGTRRKDVYRGRRSWFLQNLGPIESSMKIRYQGSSVLVYRHEIPLDEKIKGAANK